MKVTRCSGAAPTPAACGLMTAFVVQMLVPASPVEAQSLLQLFGLSSAPQVRTAPRIAPSSIAGGHPVPWRYSPAVGSRAYVPPEGSGSYTTVCVRICDGYYFPISHRASQGRFHRDEELCQSRCGASEARLFYYPSGGSDMRTAVDLTGRTYGQLATAFLHRKKLVSGCACKPEPWAEASLARHQQYALAENRVTPSPSSGIGSITIVAGAYPNAAPASSDVAGELDSGPADTTGGSSEAAAMSEDGAKASVADTSIESTRDVAPTGRSGGRGAPWPKLAAARQATSPSVFWTVFEDKPAKSAVTAGGTGKLVWPGDIPSRTR